ncbi:hypothetical protein OKW27_001198 [Paraburkholderia sp. 35.1]
MSPLSDQQFAAYVGIDWADTKHDICLQAADDTRREFSCVPIRSHALMSGQMDCISALTG